MPTSTTSLRRKQAKPALNYAAIKGKPEIMHKALVKSIVPASNMRSMKKSSTSTALKKDIKIEKPMAKSKLLSSSQK